MFGRNKKAKTETKTTSDCSGSAKNCGSSRTTKNSSKSSSKKSGTKCSSK